MIEILVKESGVNPDITTHSFRRSYFTFLYNTEKPLVVELGFNYYKITKSQIL